MHINYILVNKQMSLFKQVIGYVEDNLFERNRLKTHLKTAEKFSGKCAEDKSHLGS